MKDRLRDRKKGSAEQAASRRLRRRSLRRGGLLAALLSLAACQQTPPLSVSFSATPTTFSVGDPVVFAWRGTGAASCSLTTGQRRVSLERCNQGEVTETYAQPGTFVAELVYTAQDGSSLRREAPVTVRSGDAAGANFTTAQDGLSVTFVAAPAAASTFAWDFGDGQTGSGAHVIHTYSSAGQYLVTLSQARGGQKTGQVTRSSRTVTVTQHADPGRIILFSGEGLGAWERVRGGAANWPSSAAYFEVAPGKSVSENDLKTREQFGDFRLHLEFWVPKTPPETSEQARGNSGVYLQGRYELQILDSYGRALSGQNDAGAVYGVQDAAQNASLPPETWQSYDLLFRAARFAGEKKLEDARVSVFWNGQLVQANTVIPGPTRLGNAEVSTQTVGGILQGPVVLQDHGYRVRFRNIWLEPR